MSNFLVKDGDKAEWGIPDGYPKIDGILFNMISTDGNEQIEYSNPDGFTITYIKISNLTPTYEEMQSATITVNGQTHKYTDFDMGLVDGKNYTGLFSGEWGIITYEAKVMINANFTIPTPGIWISRRYSEQYKEQFPNGMIVACGDIQPISPVFLPNNIGPFSFILERDYHGAIIGANKTYQEILTAINSNIPVIGYIKMDTDLNSIDTIYLYKFYYKKIYFIGKSINVSDNIAKVRERVIMLSPDNTWSELSISSTVT